VQEPDATSDEGGDTMQDASEAMDSDATGDDPDGATEVCPNTDKYSLEFMNIVGNADAALCPGDVCPVGYCCWVTGVASPPSACVSW
jgi:hypothetical protein